VTPKEQAHLAVSAITHEGMSGKNNEDRYSISAHTLSADTSTPAVFAIVADGIGGHQAGEIAAEIAVETISAAIADSDGTNPLAIMRDAILQASQRIRSQAEQVDAMRGMGSTCACAWIINNQLYTATVGDSRIYLIRDEQIQQISTDHTWIQEAITFGIIKPEQAKGHPQSHVIRQYLGSIKSPEVDFRLRLDSEDDDQRALRQQGSKMLPKDRLVLCSDGLTDLVSDNEIMHSFEEFDADTAVQHLVNLANQYGGHDNITIVTLQFPEKWTAPGTKKPSRTPLYWLASIGLALIAIIILAALAFFAWRLTLPNITATPSPISTVPLAVDVMTASPETEDILTSTPMEITETIDIQSIQTTYTPWPTSTSSAP